MAITLITGGVRSGKSRYALKMALSYKRRLFIATAVAFDDEMKKRIEKHKQERGNLFKTIEEPVYLSRALDGANNFDVCLIDCLTVWVSNLLFYKKEAQIEAFFKALDKITSDVVVVSNEVGLGIMPDNTLSRRYVDLLGEVNQKLADVSDRVVFMISGQPLNVKS
ncbi:bifunctional adenosylcobinamide kinase/adenosylcobinamide-phosphate guanylyltransferase [Hippea maritima]|uniref:Adenosylcobinamide kinase n=1 Tax=Hippea maritima (strain ATCC 700847 / DSM 10411 / MH2) TaxID=760142 RepID=F2LXG3_HIPMA|nr:bifunctional adenosylcobinamide kinase/adenosylcobinamide-phosphate guanylyltransferase [Hippea maritima]AEA34277.1 Adenosylcobinamide-phosphateguanylyltransferase [Hippea maritima DSM 10411]